jgi:hypothetical protein
MFRKALYNVVIINVLIFSSLGFIVLSGLMGGYLIDIFTEGTTTLGIVVGGMAGMYSVLGAWYSYLEGNRD